VGRGVEDALRLISGGMVVSFGARVCRLAEVVGGSVVLACVIALVEGAFFGFGLLVLFFFRSATNLNSASKTVRDSLASGLRVSIHFDLRSRASRLLRAFRTSPSTAGVSTNGPIVSIMFGS